MASHVNVGISFLCLIPQVKACDLLLVMADKSEEEATYFSEGDCRWIFAGLVVLDSLQAMEANTSFNLQRIRRQCERQRMREVSVVVMVILLKHSWLIAC